MNVMGNINDVTGYLLSSEGKQLVSAVEPRLISYLSHPFLVRKFLGKASEPIGWLIGILIMVYYPIQLGSLSSPIYIYTLNNQRPFFVAQVITSNSHKPTINGDWEHRAWVLQHPEKSPLIDSDEGPFEYALPNPHRQSKDLFWIISRRNYSSCSTSRCILEAFWGGN